jgi:D-glucosaminate-6-phosphate ammonia-lyase
VKRYLLLDHAARRERDERVVAEWCQAFNALPGVRARRSFPNEAGQPLPRLEVTLEAGARLNADELVAALRDGTPSIEAAGAAEPPGVYLNPMTLSDAEASLVTQRLLELLA